MEKAFTARDLAGHTWGGEARKAFHNEEKGESFICEKWFAFLSRIKQGKIYQPRSKHTNSCFKVYLNTQGLMGQQKT